jgi:chromosome segregation ATPase
MIRMDNGFIDLRLNTRDNQNEESFWPSFTDIMTVIVMIFLLAMVILLLRNMELLNQLRETMASERQAMELARTTGEENETLEERLIAREHELTMMRMQLMQLREQSDKQASTLSAQKLQITRLNQERDELTNRVGRLDQERTLLATQVTQLTREEVRLQTQLSEANRNIENLSSDLEQANLRQTMTLEELQRLRVTLTQKENELLQALTTSQEKEQQITDLKQDFSDLKIQYNKLLRPARTAKGKTLVEVRYTKRGKGTLIEYKGPGDSAYRSLNPEQLDQRLTRLKAKDDNLYIKVIIPKDSGLSYNEAWTFTTHLHRNYDYYYQEEAKKERIVK